MIINIGQNSNLEEFQCNYKKFQEAFLNKEINVQFTLYSPGSAPSNASPLEGRITAAKREESLDIAWNQFVFSNTNYIRILEIETNHTDIPLQATIKRTFSSKDKEALLTNLKTSSFLTISIETNEGTYLVANLAFLPDYFHIYARHSSIIHLPMQTDLAKLFLDYYYGVPISNFTLSQLIQLHIFADYTKCHELYIDTLRILTESIDDINRDTILPVLLQAILAHSEIELPDAVILAFLRESRKTAVEKQKSLFNTIKDLELNTPHLMCMWGSFIKFGIGTKSDPIAAQEWYDKAQNLFPFLVNLPAEFEGGFFISEHMRGVHRLLSEILSRPDSSHAPKFMQEFYKKIALCTLQERKNALEFLQSFETRGNQLRAAAVFHLAIFYQEGIVVNRNEANSQSLLREAEALGSLAAKNYLHSPMPPTSILEFFDADVEFAPQEISFEKLEELFEEMLYRPSPLTEKDFYSVIKKSNRQVQQEFRLRLKESLKNSFDDSVAYREKYHLAKFFFSGMGGIALERPALELFNESAAAGYKPAEKWLRKVDGKKAKKSSSVIQDSLIALRRSPDSFLTINSLKVSRAFLPNHPDFSVDTIKWENIDEETLNVFIDFQLGLGISVETPFLQLIGLYHLAYKYEITALLQAIASLMQRSSGLDKSGQFFPELVELLSLDEKPALMHFSIYPFFIIKLETLNKSCKEDFFKKLKLLPQKI